MNGHPNCRRQTRAAFLALTVLVSATHAHAQAERLGEAAQLGVVNKDRVDTALARLADAGPADVASDDGGPLADPDGGVVPTLVDGGPPPAVAASSETKEEDKEAEELAALIREQEEDRARAEAAAKAAELARLEALERARQAKSALLEKILRKIAAGQGALVALAESDQRMRDDVEAALSRAQKQLAGAQESLSIAKAAAVGKGDALLDAAIAEQRVALNETRDAMRTRSSPLAKRVSEALEGIPTDDQIDLSRQLAEDDRLQVNKRLAELAQLLESVQRAEDALERTRADLWYEVADARLRLATAFNRTRLTLIDKTSTARAAALRGLTEAGRDNLTVALEHLGTLFSFHIQRRVHDVRILPSKLADPLYSGSLAWVLVKLLLTIAGALFAFRRGPALYERIKKAALSRMTNRARVKLFESILALVEDAAPQAALLALALWTVDLLKKTGPEPELSTIFGVFIWVLTYQLAAKLTHRLVLRLARRRHTLTVPTKLKILRTVRSLMRFGFVAAFILVTTTSIVGAGILFAFVRALVVLYGVGLFLVLVRRWREDIMESYLEGWSGSALAGVIENNRERWFSLPLAVAALVSVAARGAIVLVKDFVLGFEQSRKALAYLFQIRVERKTKEQGRRQVDTSALPDIVRDAFDDVPCEDPRFLIDRFSAQAPLAERLCRGDHLSVLVTAAAGGGATTWLRQFLPKVDDNVEVIDIAPPTRVTSREEMFRVFADALGQPHAEADELHEVRQAITAKGRPVLFVLDGLDQLFLRGLDGYHALNALADIMVETEFVASYVVLGRLSAVKFLDKTRALSTSFDVRIDIPPFNENEVRDLVQRRQRTTRLSLSFEDLLVKELDATVDSAHVVETENGYLRLLWTFAEGNPRTVLHFWLRSLVPDGDGLKVQLHDAPSADDLEVIPTQERFFLQALVLHRSLTPAQMAQVSNLPLGRARAHVARAQEMGVYEVGADGGVVVRTHFWQSAVRYLRRKNML